MNLYTTRALNSSSAWRSGANTAPADFDPVAHPIISKHFFGIEPLRSIGEVAAAVTLLMQEEGT